jgi:hypothetical protein
MKVSSRIHELNWAKIIKQALVSCKSVVVIQYVRTEIISYPYCPYQLTDIYEIWYTQSHQNKVKQLPVS